MHLGRSSDMKDILSGRGTINFIAAGSMAQSTGPLFFLRISIGIVSAE